MSRTMERFREFEAQAELKALKDSGVEIELPPPRYDWGYSDRQDGRVTESIDIVGGLGVTPMMLAIGGVGLLALILLVRR